MAKKEEPHPLKELSLLRSRISEGDPKFKFKGKENQKFGDFHAALLSKFVTDVFIVLNMDLRIEYATPSVEKVLGYTTDEINGKRPQDLLPRHSLKRALNTYKYILQSLKEKTFPEYEAKTLELEIFKKNKKTVWSEVKLNLLSDSEGKPFLILGIVRDITERRTARLKIQESEKKYRNLVEHSPLGICIAQGNPPKISFFNKALTHILGYSPKEVESFPFEQIQKLIYPEDRELFFTRYKNRLAGKNEPVSYSIRAVRKDGNIRWVDVFSTRVTFQGKPAVQAVFRDTTDVKKTENQLKQSLDRLQRTIEGTISAMARIVEMRDPYTSGHQRKVAELSLAIAQEMNLPQDRARGVYMAALIHDIGKTCIPSDILSRPSKLSENEFALIKVHPEAGYGILKSIDFPWPVADIVLQHHEHIDGSGYPKGLEGGSIHLEAKILAVADLVEAMSSHRPYRPARSINAALEELVKQKGIHFEPKVVEACLYLFQKKHFTFT